VIRLRNKSFGRFHYFVVGCLSSPTTLDSNIPGRLLLEAISQIRLSILYRFEAYLSISEYSSGFLETIMNISTESLKSRNMYLLA